MKKSIYRLLTCVVALLALSTQDLSAQMVAVRTDALKDLLMTPNVGVDLVVGEKCTLGAEVAFNRNPWGVKMQMTSVTPEFRYWFNGRPLTRQYVGVVANMTGYKLNWKDYHHGDAVGLGLSFGHVWTLTQRWNIDLSGSFGVVGYREKFFRQGDDISGYGERFNARGYALVPIKLGVSIVYVIR